MEAAFETLAIHAGQEPDPLTGAVMTPIYQTSTFRQKQVGVHVGYEYARTGNPTRTALETCLARLESGQRALAFASGMAATDAILHLFKQGDHVLAAHDLYGGTYRLFEQIYQQYGLENDYADATNPEQFLAFLKPTTKLIWLESPTNPLLAICDLKAISQQLATIADPPLLCVDNTFATPYLQQPLQLGADLVVHSTTKYLGGHSDLVGGAVVVNDDNLAERLAFIQNAVGAVPGPMDCFLTLRGIKTLPLRMDRHASNAAMIASYLQNHPAVSAVYYPGLDSHPQHELAKRQMRNGGGMISFEIKGSAEQAKKVVESTQLFTLAESLGGVESLIELPAAMTHLSTQGSPLEVSEKLIRLSVGIEHVEDLVHDLDQALSSLS